MRRALQTLVLTAHAGVLLCRSENGSAVLSLWPQPASVQSGSDVVPLATTFVIACGAHKRGHCQFGSAAGHTNCIGHLSRR